MNIYVFWKEQDDSIVKDTIFPIQTHSNNIVEIKTWKENLEDCDGIFTSKEHNFKLWIKTADCAAIVFEDDNYYGILHSGWRWLVNWIIEKMLEKFDNPKVFVAPFLKEFEIQKDFCYNAIYQKFQDRFFEEKNDKIIFHFEKAVKSVLPENAVFDTRDTYDDLDFYSHRRWRNNWQNNITIVENS